MRVPIYPKQIREFASDGVDTAQRIVSVAPRIADLFDAGEAVLDDVAKLIARFEQTRASAQVVIDRTAATVARLAALLDQYEPPLRALNPPISRLSETVSSSDLDALLTVVRRGPGLTGHVADDVLPVVETLKTVGPDLTELLAVSRALNEILGSVPGLSRAKKRVDEELEQAN